MITVEIKYSDEYEKTKEDIQKRITDREMELSMDLFSNSATVLCRTSESKIIESIKSDSYINSLRDYLIKITLLQVPKYIIKTTQ